MDRCANSDVRPHQVKDLASEQLVTASGGENALNSEKATVSHVHRHLYGEELGPKVGTGRANSAKNSVRHGTPDESGVIHLDLETEAVDLLDRATYDYWKLVQSQTPLMVRYLEARHGGGQ
jgi:hypothetical protein